MNPWLEPLGVILLGFIGLALALACLRLRGSWWWLGYGVPLILIGLMGIK